MQRMRVAQMMPTSLSPKCTHSVSYNFSCIQFIFHMSASSEDFRKFLYNQQTDRQEKPIIQRASQIKLKQCKRKTQIDIGEIAPPRKQILVDEQSNIMVRLQMNPIDLVKKSKAYGFGNYKKYYKIRYKHRWEDPRLQVLDPELFMNRTVLDIGCNDGTVTLLIAMRFFPRLIRGVDIDYTLINKAIENMADLETKQNRIKRNEFVPIQPQEVQKDIESMPICFKDKLENMTGDFFKQEQIGGEQLAEDNSFPRNVFFRVENFIGNQKTNEKYDTIICFSLTKWIHLNFGDAGIHKLFKKISQSLNLNGFLILEPQEWRSYKKKKYFSKEFKQTYESIRLKPENFIATLEIQYGLKLVKTIKPDDADAIQKANSTFRRQLLIFQKQPIE